MQENKRAFIVRIEFEDGTITKKGVTACTQYHAIDKVYYELGYFSKQKDRSKYTCLTK